ncbi:lipoyl(octanoyl) transferase LipB [Petroclostridium sp. X23]|uniref:lipoyl(octanoyl) transferase LipB n=1 Tax=Petroclostridium sp. X23 TaxID=3045146 RepID=UPI0024AE6F5F|nr:lipoyl(octanoyl) transferase LipB [Petroclostridium sp. X23]WHH57875.1 lipoyl(octanoyl) transferase LipB [Petroclostridium sp. X23]
MVVQVVNLGLIDYNEALDIQEKVLTLRMQGDIQDTLLLLEHFPVLTMGRRAAQSNILASKQFLEEQGIRIYEVSRGGDVTYHGPGQLIGYPIFDLNNFGKDVRKFVGNIEEIFIELLKKQYDIDAGRDPVHTGVWVGQEKITAIGFAIKRWVSMHGFAFNVNTNMEHFKWIVPCGIGDKGVTSLEKILGKKQDFAKTAELVTQCLAKVFDVEIKMLERQQFLQKLSILQKL